MNNKEIIDKIEKLESYVASTYVEEELKAIKQLIIQEQSKEEKALSPIPGSVIMVSDDKKYWFSTIYNNKVEDKYECYECDDINKGYTKLWKYCKPLDWKTLARTYINMLNKVEPTWNITTIVLTITHRLEFYEHSSEIDGDYTLTIPCYNPTQKRQEIIIREE